MNPFFRVEEQGRPRLDLEITPELVGKMCKGSLSIFDFDRIVYRVSNKNAQVWISLVFWDALDNKADAIPISGFPRWIVAESSRGRSDPLTKIIEITILTRHSHANQPDFCDTDD